MRIEFVTLAVACAAALFAACLLGSTPMEVERVVAALVGGGDAGDRLVVMQIRLPRALTAFAVGVALGTSGARPCRDCYATRWPNRACWASPRWPPWEQPGRCTTVSPQSAPGRCPRPAIVGAFAGTALIAFAALRTASAVTLILIGVGLSSFAAATMNLMMNLAPNPFSLADMINWMLGSVANRSLLDLGFAAPFLIVGLGILFISRRGLSALTLGEEAASGVGLNLRRQRLAIVIGTGLATGAAVSLAGVIGFVGIVAPHIVRPMVDHDPARSLLPSALLAGLILVLADIGVRLMPTATELKLGVVAALVGAPAFVWIAMQRRTVHD